jgi:hypothetical protein
MKMADFPFGGGSGGGPDGLTQDTPRRLAVAAPLQRGNFLGGRP